MTIEIYEFKEYLFKELILRLNIIQSELDYYQELPSFVEEIDNNNIGDYQEYGHPIEWLIKGYAGTQAFMIGKADIFMNMNKNVSEKNYYPLLLTNNFSEVGLEYIYSQVAIVIVNENTDENVLSWLKKWGDDSRYFRKIIVSEYKSHEIEATVKYIIEKIIYPWHSIKHSANRNNSYQINIFDNEDEEDESE